MKTEDPYEAPRAKVDELVADRPPIRAGRIAGWAILVFVSGFLINVVGGYAGIHTEIAGVPVAEIISLVAAFFLYLVFIVGTSRYFMLQLLCVYALAQLLSIALGMTLTAAIPELFGRVTSYAELARSLLACLLAYAGWYIAMRKPG